MTKDFVCLECGKKFKDHSWKQRKYCSVECASKNVNNDMVKSRKVVNCEKCGKEFTVLESTGQRFCSRECGHSSRLREEDHPRWKGGIKNRKFNEYKKGAEKRGINFNLTEDQFFSFWQQPCSYCGAQIETIGLDRVDSNIGYKIGNVVSCCTTCNWMKLALGKNEFISHVRRIVEMAIKQSISSFNRLGENVTIWHYPNIYGDSIIGDNVKIGSFCEISGAVIEDGVSIGAYNFIPKKVTIKKNAWLGPCVTFTHSFPPATPDEWKETIVDEGACVGASVTVLGGVHIGKGAIIGAGSLVLTDVPDGETWAGVPAKRIGGK